jgi:hypothetical protein
MPRIIDSDSEFPKYEFSSKNELVEFFGQEIDRLIGEKGLPGTYNKDASYFRELANARVGPHIDKIWAYCEQHNGRELRSVLHTTVGEVVSDAEFDHKHKLQWTPKRSASTEPPRVSETKSPLPKATARPWLLAGGIGMGAVLIIHGAYTAATAVDEHGQRRDWQRTALHAAEAVIGAAVTWASLLGFKGRGPLQR